MTGILWLGPLVANRPVDPGEEQGWILSTALEYLLLSTQVST